MSASSLFIMHTRTLIHHQCQNPNHNHKYQNHATQPLLQSFLLPVHRLDLQWDYQPHRQVLHCIQAKTTSGYPRQMILFQTALTRYLSLAWGRRATTQINLIFILFIFLNIILYLFLYFLYFSYCLFKIKAQFK